jgi:hypothetical protein
MGAPTNLRPQAPRCRTLCSVVVAGAAMACALVLATASPAVASPAGDRVHVDVVVNGQAAASSSDARPAQLYPTKPTKVRLVVSNNGRSAVTISTVRFEGRVLGLPLFSYDSAVSMTVLAGTSSTLTFPVNMGNVGGLATGLIAATVTLIGPNGDTVASQTVITKVHGSFVSIYGLFALAVLILTLFSLVAALLMLVRHRLPQNRWVRGVRFFVPGFGIGLILTFTLAASGLFAPGAGHWLPLLAVPSLVGLGAGLLTPAPDEEEFDDYDEDVLLAQIVVVDEDPLDSSGDTRATSGVVRATDSPVDIPDSRATVAP